MECSFETLIGVHTAIVTPFTADASAVDYDSLSSLLAYQLENGVSGIVVCGSTGEAAALSAEEFHKVIEFVVKEVGGRVPVTAGLNANVTWKAIEQVELVQSVGVDAVLVVIPFYNKPTQDGIVEHFESIYKSTSLPLIAYNVPGRTGTNLLPVTLERLVEKKLIIGLKEASGSMDQWLDMALQVGDCVNMLSGEDSLVHAAMASRGKGTISASANIIPKSMVEITSLALEGKFEAAFDAQMFALPVIRAMFMETNPVPVKAALALRGVIAHPTTRLPLVPAAEKTVAKISELLKL